MDLGVTDDFNRLTRQWADDFAKRVEFEMLSGMNLAVHTNFDKVRRTAERLAVQGWCYGVTQTIYDHKPNSLEVEICWYNGQVKKTKEEFSNEFHRIYTELDEK